MISSMLLRALSSAGFVPRVSSRAAALVAAIVAAAVAGVARADTGEGPWQGDNDDDNAPSSAGPLRNDTAEPQQAAYPDSDPSALTDFRQTLDPHGTWVQDPTYGTVWVPSANEVGADFAPYQTAGHWEVTDTGDWMWQSDYDWGFIPFHYGRWVWAGSFWAWIPGRTYAPAWVTWRIGDGGYIGWAPLPPTWTWFNGNAVGLGVVPWAAYCFVPTGSVFYPNLARHVVRDGTLVRAAAGTTRPYHPATPSVGHAGHLASHRPSSPSFAEARIPGTAIPSRRVPAGGRALADANRVSMAVPHPAVVASNVRASTPAVVGASPPPRRDAWHTHWYTHDQPRGNASAGAFSSPVVVPGAVVSSSGIHAVPHVATPAFRAPVWSSPVPSHGSALHGSMPRFAPSHGSMPRFAPSHGSMPRFSGGGGRRR